MRTLALALVFAAPVIAQPPATPDHPPAAPAAPSASPLPFVPPAPVPAPAKPGDISPEAQAVFDRAVAAYKGAKTYREAVLMTLRQKASGLLPETEPPVDQASVTAFTWGGPERFTVDTRDFSLFRNGKEATVLVKSIGQYVQREPKPEDNNVFASIIYMHPVYQALAGQTGTVGKPPFGRFVKATEVKADEVRGVKGKRVFGIGLPPEPGFELPSPVTMFFADDTGLLMQATYDVKAMIQSQLDRNYEMMKNDPSVPKAPKVTIDLFTITSDWTEAKLDSEVPDAAFVFKPGATDVKVERHNLADGDASAQHTLLNKPAPDFTTTTLDGKPWSLKEQLGKVVLLQFWSSSSQLSRTSLMPINSMDMAYRPRGVVIVGVNQDYVTMLEQTRRLAKEKKAAFPILSDSDKTIGNAYRVAFLPCTVLIDKEGVVRSITNDFDAASQVVIAERIDNLLAGKPIESTAPGGGFQLPRKGTPAPTAPPSTPPTATPPAGEPSSPAPSDPKKP